MGGTGGTGGTGGKGGRGRMGKLHLIVALMVGSVTATSAQTGRWRGDDRVVITDFSHVQAVAAGRDMVYAATTGGLVIYDRRFNRWEAPFTRLDGFPDVPVRAAIVDPADDALWLATDAGVMRFQPQLRQLEVSRIGPVNELMFDRDDPVQGLLLRGDRGGWELLPRGQVVTSPVGNLPPVTRRVQSVPLSTALQRFPAAEAMGATTLVDRRLRRYNYTSAAIAPGNNEAYFGTDGLGLFRFDALIARLQPLPFGLRGSWVGAMVVVPGGTWVGTNAGVSSPSGFARIGEDLSVQYEEGGTASPAFREVRDLLARGVELWAATDRGVFRFEPGGAWRVIDMGSGLPGDRCRALAQGPAGVWIGTDRGLVLARDDGSVALVGAGRAPVLALSAARDSVWVGTANGLRFAVAGQSETLIPSDVDAEPVLASPITALARSADTVIAATPERIAWRARGGTWNVERVISSEVGEIRALSGDRGGVWIGGTRGFAFFRFVGRSFVTYHSSEDLPGPINRLAVAGPFLWIATESGLVRYSRRALVP